MITLLEPPLRWPGGKSWLVPHLGALYAPHRHRRLVEPFCGSLAVALGLRPERALLCDITEGAINFYRHIQNGLVCDIAMENTREAFEAARQRSNVILHSSKHSRERALLYYYINRTCYGGVSRMNQKGEPNCTFGNYEHRRYAADFLDYQPVLKEWEFRCQGLDSLVMAPDDFVYADPPFDQGFNRYAKVRFTWDDQVRLAEALAAHKGPVVASNAATDRVMELYTRLGFTVETASAPRGLTAKPRCAEIVATRNL